MIKVPHCCADLKEQNGTLMTPSIICHHRVLGELAAIPTVSRQRQGQLALLLKFDILIKILEKYLVLLYLNKLKIKK